MLTQREIISTLEMLRNENLDVRTVTLGLNLLDCAGSDLSHVRRRIAERVMRLAGQLVPVCDRVGQKYGIPVVVGTHPIPLKYFEAHQKLPYWKDMNMAEIAGDLMKEDRAVMEAYN